MKAPKVRNLYLIIRGEQSEFHKAPFHPYIICTQKHTADWEAGDSNEKATVYMKPADEYSGFLMVRYKGFDIDYGNVVKEIELFDGTTASFSHTGDYPWNILDKCIWWSYSEMPEWLKKEGVQFAQDEFTKSTILSDMGTCLLTESRAEKIKDMLENIETPQWL